MLPKDVTLNQDLPALPADTTNKPSEKYPYDSDPLYQKMKFVFEPPGEPPVNEDSQRPESYETDHHWKNENRERWQLHSERGPSIEPESNALPPPKPFEHLVNPATPPPGREYDRHWTKTNFDSNRAREVWERVRSESTSYTDESLSRETLNDDYQQLFVTMVLDHVQHVVECMKKKQTPEPLRLLLLGTAGSGKTRAVQTLLQELQRALFLLRISL